MIKKWISEFLGTMLLVIFGCGTAVAINFVASGWALPYPFIVLTIALAFGLVLTALVDIIGKVSGAHVNPAVSIAMLIDGRMSILECIEYICFQFLGGIAGAGLLCLLFTKETGLGANGYGSLSAIYSTQSILNNGGLAGLSSVAIENMTSVWAALIIEMILTFVFVSVVLSVTEDDKHKNPALSIGAALTLVHIFGILFTGTSVNPARSLGPAIFQGGEALSQVWVFIVAPLIGGALAALFHRFVLKNKKDEIVAEKEFVPHIEMETVEEPKKVAVKKAVKKATKKEVK